MDDQIQTSLSRESSRSINLKGDTDSSSSFESSSSIGNGSFETADFREWNTIGDTSIETDDLGIFPTDGTYQALITNGFSDAGGSVVDSDLEEFLDLAPGSLDGLVGGDATEGSVIKQEFTVEAGDIVSFDWNFLTNEATPDFTFNDTAFLSVSGFTFELADTGANFVDASGVDQFNEQTGAQTLTFSINAAGTYTIGFGVVDVGDEIVDSGLAIDNVAIQPSSSGNISDATAATTTSSPSVDLILGEGGFTSANSDSINDSASGLVFGENGFEVV
ncbi:MAG: hypothetical protein WBM86_19245 [Waterburya sp.]